MTAKQKQTGPGCAIILLICVGVAVWIGTLKNGNDTIKAWCRSNVHVGDYLIALNMPGSPHLVSVSNGVWTYDDGVTITFLEGQVYDKQC